ncbi:phosphatidate cytidylyltransferase [Microvirga solisilvae]|uniref:phosphatidate cytidylyltransferase n=1 Tax=Microvirga solisilvae TaxID=2919498 RepID=UPI001FAFDE2D|nr:phosphatidate cytidylyltransferase [Microvirga solisilvae]
MTLLQKSLILFGIVVAILALASAIGTWLARKTKSESGVATVENLNARIKAWWGMIAIFAACYALGFTATVLLFALTSFYTLREFISLTPTQRADHAPLVLAFYVLLPLQYWLVWSDWYGLFAILIPVYGFLLLPSLSSLQGDPVNFLLRVSRIQWAVMLTVYCISHAPALILLQIPGYEGQGFLLLFFLTAVVQFSDVMQYVFGKLMGKTKLAPVISPSKTVEGLVGGGLSAMALGAALFWITPFSPLAAAAMAGLIVIAGFLGGLSLSAVKRSMGAKDWGTMVQGHGGVLDRMDSVSFAAPLFFHLTRFFYTV